jgi:hypothetical protein
MNYRCFGERVRDFLGIHNYSVLSGVILFVLDEPGLDRLIRHE